MAAHPGKSEAINVFTYGSLMYPDIFEQVTGSLPVSLPAVAHNWLRHGLANRAYPGAMPSDLDDAVIEGVLWLDLTPAALSALDEFEGHEYRRIAIEVKADNGLTHRAYIYQWLLRDQVQGSWDLVDFETNHRQRFVQIHGRRLD